MENKTFLEKEEEQEEIVDKPRVINNKTNGEFNSKMNLLKNICYSSSIVEFIILAVCLALSITDIITDILLSVKYFNGFDQNCLKVYSNLTTVAKSSTDQPVHPGWFYLT